MSGTNGNGHANGNGKKKPKDEPLTLKQKTFAKHYLETGMVEESAKEAGYKTPGVQGSQTLARLRMHSEFIAMMDKMGLSDEAIINLGKEGMAATKKTYAVRNGKFSDEREDPDWGARERFLRTAAQLRRRIYNNEEEGGRQPVQVVIINYDPASASKNPNGGFPASPPSVGGFAVSHTVQLDPMAPASAQDHAGG